MGLLVGMVFYPVISETKRHKLVVWIFRLAAIPIAVVLFVVLIRNFYTSDPYQGVYHADCVVTYSLTLYSMLVVSLPILLPDEFKQPLQRHWYAPNLLALSNPF